MIKKTKKYSGVAIVFILAVILFFPGKAQVQNEPDTPLDVPLVVKDLERNAKIQSRLHQIIHVYENHDLETAKQMAKAMNIEMIGDSVRVVVEGRAFQVPGKYSFDVEDLKARITTLGGHVETSYKMLVQTAMPFYSLRSLAELPEVDYLRLPYYARPMAITSEGVQGTGADQYHNLASYHGPGTVTVCVLDAGFTGYSALLGTELPPADRVETRSFRADNNLEANVHGTACAEIVHDMAPDADLVLVNFNTDVEHHNAVDWIIAHNDPVDVISYSMGWYNIGDYSGQGPINADAERARDAGIIWCSAMGNEANFHWQGPARNPNSDDWINFENPGDPISEWYNFYVYAGTIYGCWVSWDDWGTYSAASPGVKGWAGRQLIDYDLLFYQGLTFIGGSWNNQAGGAPPTESLFFIAGSTGWRSIRLFRWSEPTPADWIEIFWWNGYGLEHSTKSSSAVIPACSNPHVVAVGAHDHATGVIHSYSSRGPTNDNRIKPEFSAPAGVSGSTYGMGGFYGTSAATPHVAGAFALLLQKTPFTLDQIFSILQGRGVDKGASGADNVYGKYGELNLK